MTHQRSLLKNLKEKVTLNSVHLALSMCESGRLEYVSSTSCRMRMAYTAPGDKEWWFLDLAEYWLPSTELSQKCRLCEDSKLTIATIIAIDVYLRGAANTKATHKTIATIASTIAKYWEWGRLNGIYEPKDWTPAHFRLLERQLGKGKWPSALNARARVEALLETQPSVDVIARLDNRLSIREELRALIGTNLSAQELSCARGSVHRYVSQVAPKDGWCENKSPAQPTVTWLLQAFWAANLLVRTPEAYSFRVTPFVDPVGRANKLAKRTARTPTLSVEQAISLLIHSRKYVYVYAEEIIKLVRELGCIAIKALEGAPGDKQRYQLAASLWEQSQVRKNSKDILGVEISMMSKGAPSGVTVPRLVDMLISACVILIASMNGRRKDEIIHKKVGLHRDSLRVVDDQLQIYESLFYIEKTLKSYAPYFVNQTTFDAFNVLRKLEEAQLEVEQLFTREQRTLESLDHSMFWTRNITFTKLNLMPRVWFKFSFDKKGAGMEFANETLGQSIKLIGGGAHVFRRFYAVIYFYRFEHGGLLSIRYQLAHWNCEVTRQYVTDSMINAAESRIPLELRRAPDTVRAALNSEWVGLNEELLSVGSEKLQQVICKLLDGRSFSGGFPKLVERIHRLLMADVNYSSMDKSRKATALQRMVEARGHSLRPLPHADCAAGSSPARGAKCSREKGGGPEPINATAKVCATCAYSWTSEGHLAGLKVDLDILDRYVSEAPPNTLLWERRILERKNLQEVIWLHEHRINRAAK